MSSKLDHNQQMYVRDSADYLEAKRDLIIHYIIAGVLFLIGIVALVGSY